MKNRNWLFVRDIDIFEHFSSTYSNFKWAFVTMYLSLVINDVQQSLAKQILVAFLIVHLSMLTHCSCSANNLNLESIFLLGNK